MDDIITLRAEIEQLKTLVESLVVDRMAIGEVGQQGMIGDVVPFMPVLGEGSDSYPGCFEIVSITNNVITFTNPYYSIGGKTYLYPGNTFPIVQPCIIYLSLPANPTTQTTVSLNSVPDLAGLQAAQTDYSSYCIPLYKFDENFDVECDFRNVPTAAMGEM